YFEVTKSSRQFIVKAERATVHVLGTHFNIMAYDNESDVETTLLEGSVKVQSITNSTLIKPGQRASISLLNRISVSNLSEPTAAIAWKLGYFQFENADVEYLIREIARWYEVDIEYRGKLTDVSLK